MAKHKNTRKYVRHNHIAEKITSKFGQQRYPLEGSHLEARMHLL